jgi:hypothetical protein
MGTLAFNNTSGIGRGGTGVLKVDGKEVAHQTMEHTLPMILQGRQQRCGQHPGRAARERDLCGCSTALARVKQLLGLVARSAHKSGKLEDSDPQYGEDGEKR